MESKFSKNTKSGTSKSNIGMGGYGGKTKTGTPKTKLKSPKPKSIKPTLTNEERKPRKSKERIDKFPPNSRESTGDLVKPKNDTIPAWVRESSEKKPTRKEGEESKLQWRKETKKSQRSFSKNKERDYVASSPRYQVSDETTRKPFGNTFDKKQASESSERKSSWDKNSVKPGTGFEKSKTGYKGVGSAWDKSTAPRVTTRKWDTDAEKIEKSKTEGKIGGYKGKNPSWGKTQNPDAPARELQSENKKNFLKPNFKKDNIKTETIKEKYTPPKPTWEKNIKPINKKELKDPTK